jgi:transcriptional antiterminator RfaH
MRTLSLFDNGMPTSGSNSNLGVSDGFNPRVWFCVRTHQKHEHIAAAHLRQDQQIEVFLPRVRYKKTTRIGTVWRTEALFESYLFAKFDLETQIRCVQHSRAVRGVVHFGDQWPIVPEAVIEELRRAIGEEELREISDEAQVGQTVRICGGPMNGLEAVVTRVMPGPQRIAVLLEFLGRQTMVELSRHQAVPLDMRLYPACLASA